MILITNESSREVNQVGALRGLSNEENLVDEEQRVTTRRKRTAGQEGSLRVLPTGKWQARLPARLGGSAVGTASSRAEASRILTRAIVSAEDGMGAGPRGPSRSTKAAPSVADVVDAYISDSQERLAHHTVRCYRSCLATRIKPRELTIGSIRIDRLTTPDVTSWRDGLLSSGHSHYSVRYAVALLSAAYGAAAGKMHLPMNPVRAVPRQSRTKQSGAVRAEAAARRADVPAWSTMSAILDAIPDPGDRLMVLLLAWGGTRFTEAASLERIGGVSKTSHSVRIDRVIVRGRGDWVVEAPKTGERREVQLPEPLWSALDAYAISLSPAKDGRWDVALPAHGRSERYRGGPGFWTPASWSRVVWQDAVCAAGYPNMPVKRLRAHAATVLCASGASVIDAQYHLGHASLSTTQAHYLVAARAISGDSAITDLRTTPAMTLQERLDLLWERFVKQHGDPIPLSRKARLRHS
jgi:integrase